MAKFPERFATLRTLWVFDFVKLFAFFNVIGLYEKKIAILCTQVTF